MAGFLTEIDEKLSTSIRLICIGGFVVTVIHGFSRPTGDLDHVESPDELVNELQKIAGKGTSLHKKYNLSIDYVGVVTMPIDFENRLVEVPFQFTNIKLSIPEIYDLVLSKMERNSPKDYADVEFLAKKYNLSFAALQKRFDDELDFIPNRERHVTTLNFWRDWFRG